MVRIGDGVCVRKVGQGRSVVRRDVEVEVDVANANANAKAKWSKFKAADHTIFATSDSTQLERVCVCASANGPASRPKSWLAALNA